MCNFRQNSLPYVKNINHVVVYNFLKHIYRFNYCQAELDNIKAEFEKTKDNTLHQRRKVTEIMSSLVKDMGEIGAIVCGNAEENKVSVYEILQRKIKEFIVKWGIHLAP